MQSARHAGQLPCMPSIPRDTPLGASFLCGCGAFTRCMGKLNGTQLRGKQSLKVLAASISERQGLESNMRHFRESNSAHRNRMPESVPWLRIGGVLMPITHPSTATTHQ